LQTRELSEEEIQSIEAELDRLKINSNPENRKQYFKKALSNFEKYLKDTFSITFKGYYTNRGMGLGMTFGILFGIVFLSGFDRSLGIALGLSVGMLVGLAIGRLLDANAKREKKVK
jgi:tetrahydromethanopterin S-methyltransferase subunit G